MEMTRPVDDLAVRVVSLLCAERWPADEALEHDGAHAPPIACIVVAFATEDLRSDVVRSTDCAVGELAAGLAPGIYLRAIRDGKLDLVEIDRLAIVAMGAVLGLEQLLVVGCIMFFVEASGETEVSKLDMATLIEKNVVGFDVASLRVNNGESDIPISGALTDG